MTFKRLMAESLRIEGIHREPTEEELLATDVFVGKKRIYVDDMIALVAVYAPGKLLRNRVGMDVRVAEHIAPAGCPDIQRRLADLLIDISAKSISPFEAHCRYEFLHPFMGGNGRSGRTLWLWMMDGYAPLGFLHQFYYQTLGARRSGHG